VGALIEAIAGARGAVSEIQAVGEALSGVDRHELLVGLVEMQSLQAQCDAANAVLLAKVDLAMLPSSEHGKRSTASAVAAQANTNPRLTRASQQRGLWLRGFPVIAEAYSNGLISQAHVDAIKGVGNPRTNHALAEAQEYLVQAAIDCPWEKFQQALRYWALAADPDGEEPADQFEKRSMNYRTNGDGSVDGRFHLDPLAGHAFTTALDRLVQRLWNEDQEAGPTRTATQRRADAFMMLITHGAANPDANLPGALLHIVMSQTVAEHVLSSRPRTENPWPTPASDSDTTPPGQWPWLWPPGEGGPGDRLPIADDDIDARCEFINGIPLHPHWAAAAMATARFRRLVFSTEGEILEHGRTTRLFPAQAKQALLVKARGRCQEPGCDAPITWLQADHLLPWIRNGPTDIANGQILCSLHNRRKHDTPPNGNGNTGRDDSGDPDDP
jgi:hypothetical protein